ncbi:MAG: 1-deoxy-D-xylulose-5-phosphate reductoisomerase [Oscillospiraceae bacterium]|jgi:1-deoxy-D-xylulose-5-phosphate reductoisomerase|nr:1-deoxy-D-xylulose-5-phosphate reductoisomerase [Oscillospiraceae bacterium]
MTKRVIILGSTGSIGTQTLDVCETLGIRVAAISGYRNRELLDAQAAKFRPEVVTTNPIEALSVEADIVVNAIVGAAGLDATLTAVRQGRRLALANKESLVCAGSLVMSEAKKYGAEIIPVDSEHSAIFQCLRGADGNKVKRIILTASGGAFYGKSREELKNVTVADALKHPNWSMGAKVTVDSATMMNKGLELIEAMHLFGLPPEKIKVLVHRQSVVHSAVEFEDGAVIAQLGSPDMRLPIQYALTYPERLECPAPTLDLAQIGSLTFDEPDLDAFPCLALATETAGRGDAACRAMNDANETAVEKFLAGELAFTGIYEFVRAEMEKI